MYLLMQKLQLEYTKNPWQLVYHGFLGYET